MANYIKQYPIRYYAIGHSYLLHGPFEGWQTEGYWGMAASAPEMDYFHRVQSRLQEALPCSMNAIAENYAAYERLCTETATEATYRNSAEYQAMVRQLREFKPNLITVYIGGGNTIANDPVSLERFYRVLYSMFAENKPAEAVVVCPFSNRRTVQFMSLAESFGFLPIDLTVMHEKGRSADNPYYAIAQYPEYEDAVKTGAIEFRTHPGDFGHDEIARGIVEAAVPEILSGHIPKHVCVPDSLSLKAPASVNAPVQLQALLLPAEADEDLRWWTDNENLASVSNAGLLTPHNNGAVQVFAQSRVRPELVAQATVEICGQEEWYTVTFLPGTDDPVSRMPTARPYLKGEFSLKPQGPGYLPVRKGYQFTGWTDITDGDEKDTTELLIMDRNRCVRANWRLADNWDFDTVYNSAGIRLGGFNVRYGNSTVRVSSAPGTGAAVYHQMLLLPAERYSCFRVRMQVDCEQPEKGILLWVKTTEGEYSAMRYLPAQTMGELELPLMDAKGTITEFRIEPQMTDCCIHIDWIKFE